MENVDFINHWEDECVGLYFLVGVDHVGEDWQLITVHSSPMGVNPAQKKYLTEEFSKRYSNVEVRVNYHSWDALSAPKSLESFTKLFQHDEIVKDPTESFAKAKELVNITKKLRLRFHKYIKGIFWQSETGTLIVAQDCKSDGSLSGDISTEKLQLVVNYILEHSSRSGLKHLVRNVKLVDDISFGKYTPIDILSEPAAVSVPKTVPVDVSNRVKKKHRLWAKIGSLSAIIGLGALTSVNAHAISNLPADEHIEEPEKHLPGVSALTGLTSLGESAFGRWNYYRAVGGMRLFLGESERKNSIKPRAPSVAEPESPEVEPEQSDKGENQAEIAHVSYGS